MVAAGVRAVIVKVAGLGLRAAHLGRTIDEMLPELLQLEERYGCNAAGEGGEYETLTLDCPAFVHGRVALVVRACAGASCPQLSVWRTLALCAVDRVYDWVARIDARMH